MPKIDKREADILALRSECQIQFRVHHENVVRAIDSFETTGELVLVTEFIDGGNLAMLLSRNSQGLHPSRVFQLTLDLCCALHYLHGHRILHRDIKPQNVLIEKSTQRAKLTDFGFARDLSKGSYLAASIKGTPLYMAPEVMEERPYDFKADLWSLGAILYEATFGKPPFPTNSLVLLIRKMRYDAVSWPQQQSKNVTFLQGLLEKDAQKRVEWSDILQHDYISHDHRIGDCRKKAFEFTKALTESEELAKEIQRRKKAQTLQGGSQTLINLAQMYEDQRKKLTEMTPVSHLRRFSDEGHFGFENRRSPQATVFRRNSDVATRVPLPSFDNEQWLQFLDSQLGQEHDEQINSTSLATWMKPLGLENANLQVKLRSLALLAKPFIKQRETSNKTMGQVYHDARVVSSLYQCLKNCGNEESLCLRAMLSLILRLGSAFKDIARGDREKLDIIQTLLSNTDQLVQNSALDVLLQWAVDNVSMLEGLQLSSLTLAFKSRPKKVILLLSVTPFKMQELKSWLMSNKLPENCDPRTKLLRDNILT